jgi:hypothetical protein
MPWSKPINVGQEFVSKDGWSTLNQYETYMKLSKYVQNLVDIRRVQWELDEMARKVHSYLSKNRGVLLQLVFAARIVLSRQSAAMDNLAVAVLRQLSEMKPIQENRPSQFGIRDGMVLSPAPTVFLFLNREFASRFSLIGEDDDRLVNLFWLWSDCGLFARKDVVWTRIRSQVDEIFFELSQEKLITTLGELDACLLRFYLCKSLEQCLQVLLELQGGRELNPTIDASFTEVLLALADEHVKRQLNDPGSLSGMYLTICDILNHVTLVSKSNVAERQIRSQFISSIVSLSSFQSVRSFRMYHSVVEVACPSHGDYELWIGAARKSFCDDIGRFVRHPPSMSDVASFIGSATFKCIQNTTVAGSIFSFSKQRMAGGDRFHEKLFFLGTLHKTFISVSPQLQTDHKQNLLDLFRVAIETVILKTFVFEECLSIAAKQPDIFEGPHTLASEVSEMILTIDDGKIILSNPFNLTKSLAVVPSGAFGPFLLCLLQRLLEVISKSFTSICDAVLFYERATSTEQSPSILLEIATIAFCHMFRDWCSGNFTRLAAEKSENLDVVFHFFSTASDNVLVSNGNELSVAACAEQVRAIVRQWLDDFRSDRISGVDLSKISLCCSTKSWATISDFTLTELPSQRDVRLKCDQFKQSLRVIARTIILEEGTGTSVQDVLKGYNCFFDSTTRLGQIFSCYDFLLGRKDDPTAQTITECHTFLCNVIDDDVCAEAFRQKYNNEIKLCDYFLKNSSVLFRNAVSGWIKRKVDIDTLSDALVKATESVSLLFRSETGFERVELAARAVIEVEGTLEQELSTLRGAKDLELTNAGITRFELISLLASLKSHIQGFVTFCQQVKFAIVECDPLFKELKMVSELLIEKQQAPEIILERLRRVLCPRLSTTALESVRKEINDRLPALKFVSCLSRNIEVWILAREMDWIGKEGIKRFHDEYANVTNVLLGNTETFEMAVLDSLGAIIPAVALLASLTDTESMAKLFDHIERNEHIARCLVDGDFKDVKQVQCNVSSIRDWFTHGVDEISAVYGVFEAVKATGVYCLMESNTDVESGVSYELALQYKINGCVSAETIAGKHLSKFVQDVGLIQHEVGEFVEQYHILSKASQLIFECLATGHNETNLEAFRCHAGGLTEAQDLLACAEANGKDFASWLRKLRQTYPAALLFWTEELRALHRHIVTIDTTNETSLAHIRQATSRLCSSRLTGSDEILTLTSVLELVKQDVAYKGEGWLVGVARFVEQLHGALGKRLANSASLDQASKIVLHTVECDANVKNLATQVLLQQIYRVRCSLYLPGFC